MAEFTNKSRLLIVKHHIEPGTALTLEQKHKTKKKNLHADRRSIAKVATLLVILRDEPFWLLVSRQESKKENRTTP